MIELLDGPAQGKTLALHNAPHFLRVVIGPRGKVDALDAPEDTPEPTEQVHVYVQNAGTYGVMFACRGRGAGRYCSGKYRYLELAPEITERIRDREAWVSWVTTFGNDEAERAGLDPYRAEGVEQDGK